MMNKVKEFIKSNDLQINYVNGKLNIVNYNEIILISDTKIVLLKDGKTICVKGLNLTLLKLLDFEILIGGLIKQIEL